MSDTLKKYRIRVNEKIDCETLLSKLNANEGYCLTQPKSEDTKCMCKKFKEMEEGVCDCGLYIKTLEYD